MPVPTLISELSQTPASNSPVGTVDVPSSIDDYQRTHASFIATLRDGKGFTSSSALASGATTDIGAQNALFVDISGTTTITSFGTNFNGPRFLRFAGALTLTHNATTLVLPGGVNITTAAGDVALVIPKTTAAVVDGWTVVSYEKASGVLAVAQGGTGSATAAGARTNLGAAASGANTDITSLAGTATNDSAAAGKIGEYISSTVTFANRSALTTATAATVTTISLTAGDWDVEGHVSFNTDTTTTVTRIGAAINTSAAVGNDLDSLAQLLYLPASTFNTAVNGNVFLPVNRSRISLASTTTIHLVSIASFATAGMGTWGHINARRAR